MISAHDYHRTPKAFWSTCLKCGIAKQFQIVKKGTNYIYGSNHSLTNLAITEFFSSYCKTKRNFLINQQISQIWFMCQTSKMEIRISPKLNVDRKYTTIAKKFDQNKRKILTNHCSTSLYLWISRETD